MSDLHFFAPVRAYDADGQPVAGALARFYQTGTLTLVDVFQNEEETTLHPSPLEADASGLFPPVYSSVPVKVIVTDPDGVELPGYPMELAFSSPGDQSSASDVSFTPSVAIPETDVQGAIESVKATSLAIDQNLADLDDAADARDNLGLTIGADVQAYGATLASLEGLSLSAGDVLYATGADTLARLAIGTAGRALVVNSGATAPEYAGRAVTETSGTAPYYGFRAWGVIDNSGNLLAGGNVASASGTNPCAVTFTTAAPNANYAVLLGGFGDSSNTRYPHVRTGAKATSGFSLATGDNLGGGIWFAAVW